MSNTVRVAAEIGQSYSLMEACRPLNGNSTISNRIEAAER